MEKKIKQCCRNCGWYTSEGICSLAAAVGNKYKVETPKRSGSLCVEDFKPAKDGRELIYEDTGETAK